jgi:PAS domain S-box-containing protein
MNAPSNPKKNGRQKPLAEPESGYLPALRVTFYYLIFSSLWILLSDQILASLISDPVSITRLQTIKGGIFVISSTALIYLLLRREIQSRDLVEQSWRLSERKYRQLVEQASDGIFVTDAHGRYVDVNPSGCEMLGYAYEELLGMNLTDLLPADELARQPLHIQALKDGGPILFERKMRRKDGSIFFAEINAKSLDDGRLQGIVRDVSARKEAEARMRKWAHIFEHTRMGLAISDPESNQIDLANPAYAEMHGYRLDELINVPLENLYPEDHLEEMNENLRISNSIGHHIFETAHRRKDGSTFPVLIDSTTVSNSNGEKLYLIASVQDITERKISEMRIQRQLERLGALRKIDLAISSRLKLDETLDVLIDQVASRIQVDVVIVYMFNSEAGFLELAAGLGIQAADPAQMINFSQAPYAHQVIENRSSRTITDIDPARLPFGLTNPDQTSLTYHGMPLMVQDEVIGVLETYHAHPCTHDQDAFDFLEALAGQAAIAIDNTNLYQGLQDTGQQLAEAYDATLEGWSKALELRDQETKGHSHRVTHLTLQLGKEMGLSDQDLIHIRRGTLLHDIGKMAIPDSILLKPGPLTEDEWRTMRLHPVYAYSMLKSVAYLKPALDIPYCHHEWFDGRGYPRGLAGKEIPLAARIFAVVDVWDALRSNRPYRPAWHVSEVRKYLRDQSGIQFDPNIVKRFLEIVSDDEEVRG